MIAAIIFRLYRKTKIPIHRHHKRRLPGKFEKVCRFTVKLQDIEENKVLFFHQKRLRKRIVLPISKSLVL